MAFGYVAKYFGAKSNPRVYGYMVLSAISVGYLGSNYFYGRAGRLYEKLMQEKDQMADECEFDPETMDAEVIVSMSSEYKEIVDIQGKRIEEQEQKQMEYEKKIKDQSDSMKLL